MPGASDVVVSPAKVVDIVDGAPVTALCSGGQAGFVFTTAGAADKMTLHDVNEGVEIVALEAKDESPSCVAVSHDAVKVAFGTAKGAVFLWDVLYPTTMESFRTEDAVAAGPVTSMAWHPRGHVLASASEAGVVHLWDMVVGALLFPVPCHDGPIAGLSWTANGRLLLTAGACGEVAGTSGALRAWSPREVEFMGSVTADGEGGAGEPGFKPVSVRWHTSPLTCLDAMADMSRVAVTGARDGSVLLSVMKPEQGCGVFHAMPSHKAAVTDVTFSALDCPKPLRAASAAADGTVQLFDMERRLPMGKFTHRGGPASRLTFSGNADVLFSAAGCTVKAWDARVAPEEEAPVEFGGHQQAVHDFAIVNAGATVVAACGDGKLRLYDMRWPRGEAPRFDLSASDAGVPATAGRA
jgi:WD40 repeat protein